MESKRPQMSLAEFTEKSKKNQLSEAEKTYCEQQFKDAGKTIKKALEDVSSELEKSIRQAQAAAANSLPAYDIGSTISEILKRTEPKASEVFEVSPPIWVQDMYQARAAARAATNTMQPPAPAPSTTQTRTEQIVAMVAKHGGNRSAAARELNVDRTVVYRHCPVDKPKKTGHKVTANNPFGKM